MYMRRGGVYYFFFLIGFLSGTACMEQVLLLGTWQSSLKQPLYLWSRFEFGRFVCGRKKKKKNSCFSMVKCMWIGFNSLAKVYMSAHTNLLLRPT